MSSLTSCASKCSLPLEIRASTTCLRRSRDTVTFATMGRRRKRWSFATLSVAYCLIASLVSICRNVMLMFIGPRGATPATGAPRPAYPNRTGESGESGVPAPLVLSKHSLARGAFRPLVPAVRQVSEEALALRRRQDPEHLAVLCHGAACDLDAFRLLQHLHDPLIGDGIRLVFVVDELLDRLLHALARDVLVRDPADAGVEEVLELEQTLRGMHVLVRRDA